MYKVKTFAAPLEVLKTMGELHHLDDEVNEFLAKENAKLISISDSVTEDQGATIGLIRVVAYEVGG